MRALAEAPSRMETSSRRGEGTAAGAGKETSTASPRIGTAAALSHMKRVIAAGSAVAALVFGCGSSSVPLQVGIQDDAGGIQTEDGGFSSPSGDGGALSATLDDSTGHVLTSASVICAGECLDIQAVAKGGRPPYTYKWNDGTTTAKKHTCPTANTTVSVVVTDSPGVGEVPVPAQSTTAKLSVDVQDCSDASLPVPPSDAGLTGCVSQALVFTPSSCSDDAGMVRGAFVPPFPFLAGGAYSMTVGSAAAGGDGNLVGLNNSCGAEPLGAIVATGQMQTICMRPHEDVAQLSIQADDGSECSFCIGLTAVFCQGCTGP